ncbi:HAD family phosphatase [Methylobacterium currus]|uniref:HAD family phosphatase n=1 Tax=Methylobacterium currus TaxID=2051553 RepID=A0A2R4WK68_9HYPH|nr:Cof-type HAD-IIB family hydrolase [Methylobacterium currus]AWB21943.1 HAD family phosphatase [Methylobacterium currus]UHC18443.1 Cof-type HAD-IIB family hydrolase [Methylobacterium currus]
MPIALVVTDVDGTLVTGDKRLTERSVRAVEGLRERGIAFTLASSRPPIGLRALVAPLGLSLPMGAFNGSTVVRPDLTPIDETLIPEDAARHAAARLATDGIDLWVFADGAWLLTDPDGPYTDLERRTLQADPCVVDDLAPYLARAAKLVGVSRDHAGLAALEPRLAAEIGDGAAVHRSQAYYLDVTPPRIDKGHFVARIAGELGVSLAEVAVLGDMANDTAMFSRAGLSIAMGNASDAVKRAATHVTGTNEEEGFAEAIGRFVLTSGD